MTPDFQFRRRQQEDQSYKHGKWQSRRCSSSWSRWDQWINILFKIFFKWENLFHFWMLKAYSDFLVYPDAKTSNQDWISNNNSKQYLRFTIHWQTNSDCDSSLRGSSRALLSPANPLLSHPHHHHSPFLTPHGRQSRPGKVLHLFID